MLTLMKSKPAAPLPARLTETQAEAAIRAKRAELEAQELEARAAFELEKLNAERNAWHAERAAQAAVAQAVQVRSTWSNRMDQARTMWSRFVATAVPLLPLLLVNAMAVMGQFGWGVAHLDQIGSGPDDWARRAVAVLFAGALESLSLFQGYYAAKALERRDSAAGLYAGAFATSAVVAALNYSHYASSTDNKSLFGVDVPAPTATAVVFALFSFISPILWRIHSRAMNRDKLKNAGEIDTRGVKLSMSRKIWHPFRSVQVMYLATWAGIEDPAEAVAFFEMSKEDRAAWLLARRVPVTLEAAVETLSRGIEAPKALEVEAESTGRHRGQEETQPMDIMDDLKDSRPDADVLPLIATAKPKAWEAYVASVQGGNPLTQRGLASEYLNNNRHHAKAIIQAYAELTGEAQAS
jgi:hypothetical protein